MTPVPALPSLPGVHSFPGIDRRRGVLLCSVLCGLLVPAYFLGVAEVSYLAWDFRAYYAAADAALHGQPFVGVETGLPGVSYVYPPIAVALFLPGAAAGGWQVAFVVQTAVNAAAALALAVLVVRTVEARRGTLPVFDRMLVGGFCVGSAPMIAVLGLGQVDALIALAIAGGFVALERDREYAAGAALAAAALVKVFPVVLGLWLVWRRAWRAVGAAVLIGLTGLATGALLFGIGSYQRYLAVLASRSRLADFAGTVSPNFFAMSLYRPLSQALPGVDPLLYAPLSVLVLAPVVALVAGRKRGFADRLATYFVAVAATLLASPASNSLYVVYLYFPLLCLLYVAPPRRDQWLLLAGLAAVSVPLQPEQVDTALATAGAPTAVTEPVLSLLEAVLTVASVPLVGLLAILAWCAYRSLRRHNPGGVPVQPARGD